MNHATTQANCYNGITLTGREPRDWIRREVFNAMQNAEEIWGDMDVHDYCAMMAEIATDALQRIENASAQYRSHLEHDGHGALTWAQKNDLANHADRYHAALHQQDEAQSEDFASLCYAYEISDWHIPSIIEWLEA